jgi:hypothetical protein
MKSIIPIIFLFLSLVTSCNQERRSNTVASDSVNLNNTDSLPVGKGTESKVEANQGIGTSENGLSTDVGGKDSAKSK